MPDCWLEVSLHPEGVGTCQLYQGFPWFPLVPEQMLSWYPDSTFALHASHAAVPMVSLRISPYTNVTLTLGWITLFRGDVGEGALHEEERK
jgi:hypothetical protein